MNINNNLGYDGIDYIECCASCLKTNTELHIAVIPNLNEGSIALCNRCINPFKIVLNEISFKNSIFNKR